MKRLVIALSVAVLIFGITFTANATSVDFLIGDDNSISTPSALTIDADFTQLPGKSFTLSEGGSETFVYAVINSITVADNEDSYDIIAYLDFDLPPVGPVGNEGSIDVTIKGHGSMNGSNTAIFDISFDPVSVEFGNDGWFTVALSDAALDDGYCMGGMCYYSGSANIEATVTLDAVPVPEPSTLLLLGSGLFGIAAFRMRRNS